MGTTPLLVVVGCVVAVKTLVILGLVARRDRRQKRQLDAVLAGARPVDPVGWRLQWAEPGVMLVQNTSQGEAARAVELSATLTASSGAEASVEQAVRFVGTGACFEARFAGLEAWLAEVAAAGSAVRRSQREEVRRLLACTLTYSMGWLTPDGERRHETRTAQPVLPVPDLGFEPA